MRHLQGKVLQVVSTRHLVRSIAQQEGIGMAELEQVPGTGSEGRVTKKDILAYLSVRSQGVKRRRLL